MAIAVGLVVGYVAMWIRPLLKDAVLSTAASFAVPFLAWVPAEELRASGVLAVVVAGLVTGHLSPRLLPARDRLAETVNWETVAFLLESWPPGPPAGTGRGLSAAPSAPWTSWKPPSSKSRTSRTRSHDHRLTP